MIDWMKKPPFPVLAAALALAACQPQAAQGPAPDPGQPQQDPGPVAEELRRGTLPASARQVNFAWQLDEAGAKFNGRGVGRFMAPERFRLDLFGPRGETYLAAALVDGEMRVPPIVAQRFNLPSPALLWGAVGVVAPPAGARLLSAAAQGGETLLRYDLGGDGIVEYRARGGQLASVRRLRGGGVQESIDLTRGDDGALREARYRDWIAFRTLNFTLESQTDVPSFPDDIWTPPGTGR